MNNGSKKAMKGAANRLRNNIFRLLVTVYVVMMLLSGYWYWARPIRRAQFHYAYNWWTELAQLSHVPVPSSEKWE